MQSKFQILGLMGLLVFLGMLAGCSGGKTLITGRGIKAVQLGADMPPAGSRRFKGMAMRDSLAEEGEYSWRVVELKVKGGRVFVEEDFFAKDLVNRIRIESPDLHMKNGLRVGMRVQDLRESSPEWVIVPLHPYRLFDFYTRLLPGLHFVVDDPSHPMEDEEWEKYNAVNFAAEAKIVAIVVY